MFVSFVPSWKVRPGRSRRRTLRPSGDHFQRSMTRGMGLPSHPTWTGTSRVSRSMMTFRPGVLVLDRRNCGSYRERRAGAGRRGRSRTGGYRQRDQQRCQASKKERSLSRGEAVGPTGPLGSRAHSATELHILGQTVESAIGAANTTPISAAARYSSRAPCSGLNSRDRRQGSTGSGSRTTTSSQPGARPRTTGKRTSTRPAWYPSERFESSWLSLSPDR